MIKTHLYGALALIIATFAMSAPRAAALPASHYASSSVLSKGHWVKVRVSKSGIHQLTYDQLREWGFSDPTKVTVYGYPATALSDNRLSADAPDDLVQMLTYNSSSINKVCFYAVADIDIRLNSNTQIERTRNIHSLYGYYFITDSQLPMTVEKLPYNSANTSYLSNHTQVVDIDNDCYSPINGGSFFYDESLVNNPKTYPLPIKNLVTNSSFYGTLFYRFATSHIGGLKLNVDGSNGMFTYTASNLASIPAAAADNSRVYLSAQATVPLKYNTGVSEKEWDVTFSIPETSAITSDKFASLDYVTLVYPRTNSILATPQLLMYFPRITSAKQNFRISGVVTNTQIWNINDPVHAIPYQFLRDNGNATGTFGKPYNVSTGAAKIIAFNPSLQQYEVEYVGDVANQDLHGTAVPDMLIITTPGLLTQAERLAEIHRTRQGMDVAVELLEPIYNEFSSGTPTAAALRRYAKMLYDRDPSKFRYLTIFGLGTWDNREVVNPVTYEHTVTYQAEQMENASYVSKCYASDDYFGILGDDVTFDDRTDPTHLYYAPMDICVGRIPVGNLVDATAMVDKIDNYFANPPVTGSYNRAVLFCDDGDANAHLEQSDSVAAIITTLSPATTVTKVYNALYPWVNKQPLAFRRSLENALSLGQGYMAYTGHGRADRLGANENLWDIARIEDVEYPVAPFTMMSTCDTYVFDRDLNDIVGRMLRKSSGGAIVAVGACRSVYKQHNQSFHVMLANSYFSAPAGAMAGEIYRLARNRSCAAAFNSESPALSTFALAINTLCYNFGGDPALPVYNPSLNVATTKVNDTAISSANTKVKVDPLGKFEISGTITDDKGNAVTSFNGKITIEIYDGPMSMVSSSKGESSANDVCTVKLDETVLGRTIATVTGGHFTASMTLPAPLRPDVGNRISYFAVNDDYSRCASSAFNGLVVGAYDPTAVSIDTTGPVISAMYLNDASFADGDEVNSEVTLYATIDPDPSGINVSAGKIGETTKLSLDGNSTYTSIASSVIVDDNGGAHINYPIKDLSDGRHDLTLTVADNAGNRSQATIHFVVVNRTATVLLYPDHTVARDNQSFTLTHDISGDVTGRLIIEDAAGNTVYSRSIATPGDTIEWNLNDTTGTRVADGLYNAYIIIRSSSRFGNSPKVPFVVMR